MTVSDQQDFKKLIREGTLEALASEQGQQAVVNALASEQGQQAVVNALASEQGQQAVVNALASEQGQQAVKHGSLKALKSDEAKEILLDNFVDAFHEVVVPVFEEHDKKIKELQDKVFLGN